MLGHISNSLGVKNVVPFSAMAVPVKAYLFTTSTGSNAVLEYWFLKISYDSGLTKIDSLSPDAMSKD